MRGTTRILLGLLLALVAGIGSHAAAQTVKDFVSVDAARYQMAVAPASIASGFTDIAVQTVIAADADVVTPGVQLPTTLGGVRVAVNNRLAGLLFVSQYQINYIVPDQTELDGPATVVVSDDQGNVLAQGTLNVATSSLNIFTANQYGTGSPAALFTADGQAYNVVNNSDGSVNVVPAGQYLVLFGTGVRDGADVRCYVGGVEAPVLYAGAQPEFVALDQVNIQVPAAVANQGTLEVILTDGTTVSNTVTINVGGNPTAPANAPVITGLSVSNATAGQVVTLTGTNFAATLAEASAKLGTLPCQVVSTNATSMSFVVPFGAATNKVTAGNSSGERQSDTALAINTSVSGTILTTSDQPVSGLAVSAVGGSNSTVTDSNGRFVLAGVPAGVVQLRIDATGYESVPSLAMMTFSLVVSAGRDNVIGSPVYLFPDNGAGAALNAAQATGNFLEATTPVVIENDGLKLEAAGTITFPDGKTSGNLKIKRIPFDGRLPSGLPSGVNPSVIALITPIGTAFGDKSGNGAATLTFPNSDGFPAGTQLDLYSFRPNVAPSKFIKKGTAAVSNDGKTIVAPGLIDIATVWFVGVSGDNATQTTVTGRVTDSKDQPVAGASVRVRGREAKTDKDGKFEIKGVYAKNGDDLTVGASFVTPAGIRLNAGVTAKAVAPGTTDAGTIKLPAEPPLVFLLQPGEVKLTAGQVAEMKLVLSRPLASAATVNLTVDGVALTLTPTSLNVDAGKTEVKFTVSGSTPGRAKLRAVLAAAADGITPDQVKGGEAAVYVRYPVPVLDGINPTSGAPGTTFAVTGSGLSGEAQNNRVFFKQGDLLFPVDAKTLKVAATAAGGTSAEGESKITLAGTVPGLKPGEAEVFAQVVRDGVTGEPSNKLKFTVTVPPGPSLGSATPTSALPGEVFTLKGQGFSPDPLRNRVVFLSGGKTFFAEQGTVKVSVSTDPNTPSTLQGVVPRMPAGPAQVFVVVAQGDAQSAPSNKLDFTVKLPAAPVLTAVTPTQGLPGTPFTITGAGFDPELKRNLIFIMRTGAAPVVVVPTSAKLDNGAGSLTAVVPNVAGGDAQIFVLTNLDSAPSTQEGVLPGTPSNKLPFKVLSPDVPTAPSLIALQPGEGAPGTSFVISGRNFDPTPARNLIFFGSSAGLFVANPSAVKLDGEKLSGVVPQMPAGDVKVFVVVGTLANGTPPASTAQLPGPASNALPFKVLPLPAPVLTGVDPAEGKPGDLFKLTGTGFDKEARYHLVVFKQGDKYFVANPRAQKFDDTGRLVGQVPMMPEGAAEVFVLFSFFEELPQPTANVPAPALPAGNLSNKLAFKVLPLAKPMLAGITPAQGWPGTPFKITGQNFSPEAAQNLIVFAQGGKFFFVDPLQVKLDNGALVGAVPSGLAVGAASVFVVRPFRVFRLDGDPLPTITPGEIPGLASNELGFTVVAPPTVPPNAPVLRSVTPGEGAPGTVVTITGSGLSGTAARNLVFFKQGDTVVQVPADKVQVVTDGVQVPVPDLPSGAAGVFVKVTNENGAQSAASVILQFFIKPKA